MISTYPQLIEATLKIYEDASHLNKTENQNRSPICFYAPIRRGYKGCAIGCHLKLAKAKKLDKVLNEVKSSPTGINYCYRQSTVAKAIIDEVFDVQAIGMLRLSDLQSMHDTADTVETFRARLQGELKRIQNPKVLVKREVLHDPLRQKLTFDDASKEMDFDCQQTTDILTVEKYNGKAAKTWDGKWVHAPGPRLHEYEDDILGFKVGLTFSTIDSEGKAVYDYSVKTPTGVSFHGNEATNNLLRVPSHWSVGRIMAEAIAWMCLGEDTSVTFPADTTEEQWLWIRSDKREEYEGEIGAWIERRQQMDDGKFQRAIAISEAEQAASEDNHPE